MSLESMEMAQERKRYIIDVLNPPLEEVVTALIGSMPKDPAPFILAELQKKFKTDSGGKPAALVKNEELKAQLEQLKKDKRLMVIVNYQIAGEGKEGGAAAAKEEEEEEEDDDVVDEVPERPAEQNKVRGSVSAAAYGAWNVKQAVFTPPSIPKSDDQKKKLREVLGKTFLFANVSGDSLEVLIGAMKDQKVDAGTELIKQGDNGDFLFVVESGSLECWKAIGDEDKMVKEVGVGDVFGELSLMYNAPRAATVKSKSACALWKLDAETFTYIVSDSAAKGRDSKKAFLKKVDLLEKLDNYELGQLADALHMAELEADVEVFKQGDKGDMFYILEEGTASAIKDGKEVMQYKAGDYFGELALINSDMRAATIKTSSKSKLQTLPRSAFHRLLGSLEELLASASKYQ